MAFICRYGHQDVYRVLGRDPAKRPLTGVELGLFEEQLFRLVMAEFEPKAETAAMTGIQLPLE